MQYDSQLIAECWFLAGPTAVGKTETSLQLAERLDGEILSMDSMAIYRGMDIGTAKPTEQEQQRVPHHLIDLVDPHEEFSTAEYLTQALQVISDVLERGKKPLFVGGTGLYLRSLLRGVFEGPEADWELRRELEREEAAVPGVLYQKLQRCDPVLAQRLHPNDLRRIVRGLEVYQLAGEPLSQLQQQQELSPEIRPAHAFWLHPDRDWLYERINRRVDQMLAQGLLEEVRGLLKRSPPPSRTAMQGLGYKEMVDHLTGQIELAQVSEMIKTRTRQFAKRQHTWFRNLSEVKEIRVTGTGAPASLVELLLQRSEG